MSIIASAGLILAIPLLFVVMNSRPYRKYGYLLIGILPFSIGWANLDAALIDWANWPGYTKGVVITLMDSLALSIVIIYWRNINKIPLLIPFFTYIASAALSIFFSENWMSSSFYVFQLIRVLLVFLAVSTIVKDPLAVRWIAIGLSLGAIIEGLVAVDQRLAGTFQASGTVGHQNLLGMMLHFVTLPVLAILLAGERNKLMMAGVAAAITAVALGASRGSIGFLSGGITLLITLSVARRPTASKWGIVACAAGLMLALSPLMIGAIDKRLNTAGSDSEREAFEKAASEMWKDHPFGVGANQYVVVANTAGYSEAAGVTWAGGSRTANVHHAYLLAAAETGWFGLLAMVNLIAWPIFFGLRFAFSDRRDPRGEIALGASMAIFVISLHNLYEWVFVTYQVQYMFAIASGIISGLVRERRRERLIRLSVRSRGTAFITAAAQQGKNGNGVSLR